MQTEILKVTGMTCGGCTSAVTRALVGIDGVHNVDVSLAGGEAKVDFDENMTSLDKLIAAVQEAGYGVDEDVADIKLEEQLLEEQKIEGKSSCC